MVESAGGSERAWFFSAEEPSEAGGVLSVPIEVKGTGDKAGGLSLIQVSGDGDARTLACDLLTQAYVPQKAQVGAFSVTGTDDRLSEALGADAAAIEEAVAGKAAKVSPQATGATWDKEVWLDYAGNVASTTFTLSASIFGTAAATRFLMAETCSPVMFVSFLSESRTLAVVVSWFSALSQT